LAFPIWSCWFRAGIASSWSSRPPTGFAGWAARSTTHRAKPSTSSPSCWRCRSLAAPAIEAEAEGGDPARFALPRPLVDRPGCDLSFSGLKTAALRARDRAMDGLGGLRRADRRDLCASFQAAVADVLAEKSRRALAAAPGMTAFAVAGGVAANRPIRAALAAVAGRAGVAFVAPPPALCTDNAAMIAWAGIERFRLGHRDDMTLAARPRWPLDPMAAPILGSGRKGAKA
jgi:N6-L-threonylcarbamoyladenine synthase